MNACLMYRNRDFEVVHRFGPCIADVKNDLELDTLLRAMAGEDPLIYDVAQTALLDSFSMEMETVLYRQAALRDAMANPDALRELYRLTGAAIEGKRHFHFGIFINFPSGILRSSLDLMKALVDILRQVRSIADAHGQSFSSPAFTELLAMFQREFSDAYFREIEDHLSRLKLKGGVLESARLGPGNEGVDYVLRKPDETRIPWLDRLLRRHPLRTHSGSRTATKPERGSYPSCAIVG